MNTLAFLIIDILLLIAILGLAWAALASRDERRSTILFMAFGLLLAIAWGRLMAPDVALAEAAIGAGLSGALLLAAIRIPGPSPTAAEVSGDSTVAQPKAQPALRGVITVASLALAGSLIWALSDAFLDNPPNDALAQAVFANIETSGVSNPVTAVLLNFRAYDTLLELAVLLTAVLGILAMGQARPVYAHAGIIFNSLVHWMVPLLILTAGYLLWVGAHAPGGAFQAGATLAAAGVMLRLAGRDRIGLPGPALLRPAIAVGVGVFLLVGLIMLALGRPFLGYPPAWAGTLILIIESAAMLAIAATLLLAFLGGEPRSAASFSMTAPNPAEKPQC